MDFIEAATEFRLDVLSAELTTFGEDAEVVGITWTVRKKRIGQRKNLLEIAVPGGEAQLVVEHDDTIGHVIEGGAQFGLTLANFVEQPRILHGDYRLGCKIFQ